MSIDFFLVHKADLVHSFSQYVYFLSLRVSGDYVPIIRRNNCICVTLVTCYSVWMTVWYACTSRHTKQSSIQNNKYQLSHKYSCFPDDGHTIARNMQRKINKHTKKNCAPSQLYLQDYTGMHGQQNINKYEYILLLFFIPKL